jgi:hypothetical protein
MFASVATSYGILLAISAADSSRHLSLDPASALLAQASSQLGAIVLRSCK